MKNSIKLNEITAEQAINHSRNEYNPYEWKKQINGLASAFEGAKFYEYNNRVLTIIKDSKGRVLLTEIAYSHSISNGGFQTFVMKGNELIRYPLRLSHSNEDGNLASALASEGLVIASVFLTI